LVTVRLVANPETDVDFQRLADELVTEVDAPEQLEKLLRKRYPRARVVTGVTDILDRWYVYRDGHWVNSRDR
jgi:hypothetical protein